MIISRVCNRSRRYWLALAGLLAALCSCTPAAEPTATLSLPTFSGPTATIILPVTAPPLEPDRLWQEQPFGADKVGVYFYTDSGRRCVRYMTSTKGAQPHSACSLSAADTVIAAQSTEVDSTGTTYTIVAGRTLSDKISAVSVELVGGANAPTFVEDNGFLIVMPGVKTAYHVVPIDEHGNLVGSIFSFK